VLHNHPLVDLTFWSPGDPRSERIDALLADPMAPLAKHGLTGIADVYAATTGAPLHEVHAAWAAELAIKSLGVDGALTEVVPALRGAGIDFFIAKGPAIAYFDYPDPRMRPYTDLDVYVPAHMLEEARLVMRGLGYDRVPQVTGPLGGLASEMHGGRFGVVVEVHGHVIDNLHRRYVAPVAAWLPHRQCQPMLGVDVPLLSGPAHIALKAIHLGGGHRYQKLVLFRDIAEQLDALDTCLAAEVGAEANLSIALDALSAMGWPSSPHGLRQGLLHKRLAKAVMQSNPAHWDEYRASSLNTLALLNQGSALHVARSAITASRAAIPTRGRRVALRIGA
jgi:hypothetical protein